MSQAHIQLDAFGLKGPKLGCGLGGLDWNAVRPLIEQTLGDLEAVEVVVYEGGEKKVNAS